MIHYQLACAADHRFDGWFKDSAGFDKQVAAGFVECPVCGTTSVRRALMAPALGASARTKAKTPAAPVQAAPGPAAPVPAEAPTAPGKAAAGMPDQVRALLSRLRSEVEANCDYVGPAFASEARRIHKGEIPQRGIYGESTPDEARALQDDGIEVASIPWVDRADS